MINPRNKRIFVRKEATVIEGTGKWTKDSEAKFQANKLRFLDFIKQMYGSKSSKIKDPEKIIDKPALLESSVKWCDCSGHA